MVIATTTEIAETTMSIEYEGTLSKMKEAIGDSGTAPSGRYIADCVVNDDRTVMWYPPEQSKPMGIRDDKYSPDTTWKHKEDKAEIDGEIVDAIDVFADGVRHRLDARKVKTVANALEMSGSELMELAQITEAAPVYPVMFDLSAVEGEYGQVMIAPIFETPDDESEDGVETDETGAA